MKLEKFAGCVGLFASLANANAAQSSFSCTDTHVFGRPVLTVEELDTQIKVTLNKEALSLKADEIANALNIKVPKGTTLAYGELSILFSNQNCQFAKAEAPWLGPSMECASFDEKSPPEITLTGHHWEGNVAVTETFTAKAPVGISLEQITIRKAWNGGTIAYEARSNLNIKDFSGPLETTYTECR